MKREVKLLGGNSGCAVAVWRDEDGSFFVRKKSPSLAYNQRLINQQEKQFQFSASSAVKKPKILSKGFEEDLFYFDMEYIKGVPFQSLFVENSVKESLSCLDKILSSFNKSEEREHSEGAKIVNKILGLKKNSNSFGRAIDYCLDFDWGVIKKDECHGDLSFENIIIKDGDIYLIDFLDCFSSSSYLDLSKILKDLVFGWSWRNESFPLVKASIMYEEIRQKLSEEEGVLCEKLMTLHLLRILPYCEKEKDKVFIEKCLAFAERSFI